MFYVYCAKRVSVVRKSTTLGGTMIQSINWTTITRAILRKLQRYVNNFAYTLIDIMKNVSD